MPEKKEIIIEKWEPKSEAYDLLAKFLVKRFVVNQHDGKA